MTSKHQHVWELIESIKTAMLVTHDGETLRARPMQIVQDEFDGILYLFTERSSAKVYEAQANRQVCLTFQDNDNKSQVSLSGRANVTNNQVKIDELWNSNVSAWFKQRKESPDLVLLAIEIDAGEYWEVTTNKVVQLYEVVKANLTDTTPDIGDHAKVNMH